MWILDLMCQVPDNIKHHPSFPTYICVQTKDDSARSSLYTDYPNLVKVASNSHGDIVCHFLLKRL